MCVCVCVYTCVYMSYICLYELYLPLNLQIQTTLSDTIISKSSQGFLTSNMTKASQRGSVVLY